MREYIRMYAPGGTFFLTLVTYERRPILMLGANVQRLRNAFAATRQEHPFTMLGAVVLPDHMHLLIELPPRDADFSRRIAAAKARFSRSVSSAELGEAQPTPSRRRRQERAVWQRRFWEHTIRDDADLEAHVDYIHYNPVKHGLVLCPHAWPYSSFSRWVRAGRYPADWACACRRPAPVPASTLRVVRGAGE